MQGDRELLEGQRFVTNSLLERILQGEEPGRETKG